MNAPIRKYRLVTRSGFDGLICGVLMKHLDMIDEVKFVHPKDMQDGKVELTARDVTTNLPYVPGVYLAFDHHLSDDISGTGERPNHVIHPEALSAARVVYDYYGGRKAFPAAWDAMMAAVDQGNSARFTREEILHPQKWTLLNFLVDDRTGLSRFCDFRIPHSRLMIDLVDCCKDHLIDDILQLPDVRERINRYLTHEPEFTAQLQRCTTLHGALAVIDLRGEERIYAGNRFRVYAVFPQANISIHVLWDAQRANTVFAAGKSILNRSCRANIGELMLRFGGGGHENAGACQIGNDRAEQVLRELITCIAADS